jgi:hypothetical protein
MNRFLFVYNDHCLFFCNENKVIFGDTPSFMMVVNIKNARIYRYFTQPCMVEKNEVFCFFFV